MRGTIKFFDYDRGFGFVNADDGNDYFLHISATPVGVDLNVGTRVSFELKPDRRGGGKQQRTDVQLVETEAEAILP